MANHEINEEQEAVNKALRMIETSDPVHADVYNALFSILINNDVFLEKLANKMVQQVMISHVMDSTNPDMVMGADQGPVITKLIEKVQKQVDVLNTKSKKAIDTIGKNDCLTIVNNKINTALQPDGKVVVLASFSVNISGLYLISPRIRMRCPAGYNAVFKISGTQDVQYELGAYSDAFVLSPSGYCSSNHFMDFELDAGKIYYILGQTSCTEPITVTYMNTTAILLKQTD